MARVALVKPEKIDDDMVAAIFGWVTAMESAVPNHFYVEMNFPEYMKAKLWSTKVLWETGELSMEEVLHVGIAVSQANACPYCTAAFCTILNYGQGKDEHYVQTFLEKGTAAVSDQRTETIVRFALKANSDPCSITDDDVGTLRTVGLTDKGIVQVVHLVSDFASYNRINQALATDYDYRDMWREIAFGWQPGSGQPPGDNTRGVPEPA